MAKKDPIKAPNKKQVWNDRRTMIAPRRFDQCNRCGERIVFHAMKPMNYPEWTLHRCQPKVRHYTKEEIEEINAQLKNTDASDNM